MEERTEKKFEQLISSLRGYNQGDFEKIGKAFEFAKLAHSGQKRYSGEPYVLHGLETAIILASWKLDLTTIIAGILHDSVEDGAATLSDIRNEFGDEVVRLVDGVTKVSYLKLRGSKEVVFVENLRKMFLSMAKDLRVILVKLADRLHNMRTLKFVPQDRQKRIAQETLEIYAPLAERLGMGEISAELLDLAFPYTHLAEYERVKSGSMVAYRRAEEDIKKMKKTILKALASEGVKAKIEGRKKSFYSLWRKLIRPEISWNFTKIYDVVALRILVNTVSECYTVLGVVHAHYKPVPYLGVSDFIAQPKPNGYRSIHTKIFGENGKIVEIQITTHKMHEENEYGVAAHWHLTVVKSKSGVSSDDIDAGKLNIVDQDKFKWVRQLAEWQKELTDSKEFLNAVKFDALQGRIFIFSPKGDVYDLPIDATPVDFAYSVHTDLVDYLKAAKVNGRMVPLDYKLKSGQVVEIVKAKERRKPSHEWLTFVVTNIAKREINKMLRKTKVDIK